ncbi:DUF86 domain-containing protein [Paenibacillus eucommiae]|uniref:Uncharacterized protein YutE (UPF0331/DUF86 family) n=1 Tax=Paenibacillus eucommiae TaxID=1355755 RepID=A0ABS4IP40_9BACL|nr:HepT-like ribonuclease domain-containing protein [Paenibacillus eucommiae]MBP1989319.1 uncharacterized protein YutE (UPF0331/DUF86 family) [Paenibacillus eucommiae]
MEEKGAEIAAMYFVDHEQIDQRLSFLAVIVEACERIIKDEQDGNSTLLTQLAQERVLHLAIETVTDVCSLLIDAFILRDASSYEDIIEIVQGEDAFDHRLAALLLDLVKLRKQLVQDFMSWDRSQLHPIISQMPEALPKFTAQIRVFMDKELS